MQSWEWRQLHLELPEDWELLQFSRSPQTGRCAFADRYHFRFELSWRVVPGAPDFARMLADYQARLQEDGLSQTRRLECGSWQGVTGVLPDGRTTCRYGAYFAPLHCLVEAVLLWPKARHEPLESQILAALRPAPVTATGQVRWQAFGIDCLTRAGGVLEHCTADPGWAQLNFSLDRRRTWERFARRGLLPQWLHQPVAEWQRQTLPRGFRPTFERDQVSREHTVSRLRAERTALRFADLLFGRREVRAAAWVCPRDGRLYQVSWEGHRGRQARDVAHPDAPSLRCCPHLEITL